MVSSLSMLPALSLKTTLLALQAHGLHVWDTLHSDPAQIASSQSNAIAIALLHSYPLGKPISISQAFVKVLSLCGNPIQDSIVGPPSSSFHALVQPYPYCTGLLAVKLMSTDHAFDGKASVSWLHNRQGSAQAAVSFKSNLFLVHTALFVS